MSAILYHGFKGHNDAYDAIVIGSGIGGLSVASLLARAGKKVLVLERHYAIGGYTHAFTRKGYEWDVGLHYVGQVHIPGTTLNKVFRYISDEQLKWEPLDDIYDRAVFGHEEFTFVRGKENLKAEFKKHFPDAKDQTAIDKYFALLEEVEHIGISYYAEKVIPPFLAKIFGGMMRKKVLSYSDKTTLEVLKTLTDNEKLIGMLTAQYGDYGLLPSESSFYMHALLANHYMDGGGYPVGGGGAIARTVMPVIEASGGAVLFYADVKQIIVENNTAKGVEMMDGKKIYAKRVISDAGIYNTFGPLLPKEVSEQHKLADMLKQLEPSAAHMGMYIGMKASQADLKLPKCNYWVFPQGQYDHDTGRKEYQKFEHRIPVAYISFPAAKNPEWREKHPDRSMAEVIIIVPFDWFAKWEHTVYQKRGADYEKIKQEMSEQMFETLFRVQPQLKDKIDYVEISTPLSTKKFTNHQHGEIYGAAHTPKRFRQEFLKPYTPVKNLFLTGQDVMIASIAGGLMGGVLCASAILKRDVLGTIKRTIK